MTSKLWGTTGGILQEIYNSPKDYMERSIHRTSFCGLSINLTVTGNDVSTSLVYNEWPNQIGLPCMLTHSTMFAITQIPHPDDKNTEYLLCFFLHYKHL